VSNYVPSAGEVIGMIVFVAAVGVFGFFMGTITGQQDAASRMCQDRGFTLAKRVDGLAFVCVRVTEEAERAK
jgi:hypothetical protein